MNSCYFSKVRDGAVVSQFATGFPVEESFPELGESETEHKKKVEKGKQGKVRRSR